MTRAVKAMRRAARVESHAEPSRSEEAWERPARWAAAAVLIVGVLSFGAIGFDTGDVAPGAGPVTESAPVPVRPGEASRTLEALRGMPVFEGLDRPEARVYDWTSEDSDVAVLMIVDENLDV